MTDVPLPADKTIDTIVRSFTQSELALADVTSAISRFQTASEQLGSARADGVAATEALKAATEVTDRVAQQLHGLVSGLGDAVAALRAIDPDRLWTHLEESERRHEAFRSQTEMNQAQVDRRSTLLLRVSSLAAVAAIGAFVVAALLAAGVV